MNISFDGMISNTLPVAATNEAAGSFFKRGRNDVGLSPINHNKRVRRAPQLTSSSRRRDGAIQTEHSMMSDDSFSSTASLDELAESLRECTQRLDSSLLDFSNGSSGMHMRTGMNSSRNGHSRLRVGGSAMIPSASNEAAVTNSAPLLATRGPPPLMNFTRIPRGGDDSHDRL